MKILAVKKCTELNLYIGVVENENGSRDMRFAKDESKIKDYEYIQGTTDGIFSIWRIMGHIVKSGVVDIKEADIIGLGTGSILPEIHPVVCRFIEISPVVKELYLEYFTKTPPEIVISSGDAFLENITTGKDLLVMDAFANTGRLLIQPKNITKAIELYKLVIINLIFGDDTKNNKKIINTIPKDKYYTILSESDYREQGVLYSEDEVYNHLLVVGDREIIRNINSIKLPYFKRVYTSITRKTLLQGE